ncbi:MAG: hypothetical protein ACTSQ6_09015 [Candidatus Heimdallarchaeaceae archaeon]
MAEHNGERLEFRRLCNARLRCIRCELRELLRTVIYIEELKVCLKEDLLDINKYLMSEEKKAMPESLKEEDELLGIANIITPLWCATCGFSHFNLTYDPFLRSWNCWYYHKEHYWRKNFYPRDPDPEELSSFHEAYRRERERYRALCKLPDEVLSCGKYAWSFASSLP